MCQAVLKQSYQNAQSATKRPPLSKQSEEPNTVNQLTSHSPQSSARSSLLYPTSLSASTSPSKPEMRSQVESTKRDSSIKETKKTSNVEQKASPPCLGSFDSLLPQKPQKVSSLSQSIEPAACGKSLESLHSMQESFDKQVKENSNGEPFHAPVTGHIQLEDVTFMQLHDFGCTLDDTELPHHLSSQSQVDALLSEVKVMLESLPRPALITIARWGSCSCSFFYKYFYFQCFTQSVRKKILLMLSFFLLFLSIIFPSNLFSMSF